MVKRQTIGENPLDNLISSIQSTNEHTTAVLDEEMTIQKKKKNTRKQRITVQISVDVIERVKNAVFWTPGLTLASLAEEAFSNAVDQLEKNRGNSFPKRKEELKTGRPII